jgi:hypothetical protein
MALTKVDISLVDNATGFTIVTKIVTVAASKLVTDGVSQDTLTLTEGYTYKFDTSHSSLSGHTFSFATATDAAGSTQYTTGVTTSGTPGSANAYTQIVVAQSAPTLYYYCVNHASMGGTANTPAAVIANKLLAYDGSGNLPAVDGSQLTNVATGITESTSDPTVSTNPSGGVGTQWNNKTSGEVYICTDATAGENVWTNVGAGTGDVAPWAYPGESFGYTSGGTAAYGALSDVIDKFSFTTDGAATDVGNLTTTLSGTQTVGQSSATHGYTTGGLSNRIEKHSFAADGNSVDSADLIVANSANGSSSSTTDGYSFGGWVSGSIVNVIEKFPFASDTNAVDWADLTRTAGSPGGCSSATYGYSIGGNTTNVIDKFPFASQTNASDVGDLLSGHEAMACSSSLTYGYSASGTPFGNTIQKFSFTTDGNATDVADMNVASVSSAAGQSSLTYGYKTGGGPYAPGGGVHNWMSKYSHVTDANATDVGDLTVGRRNMGGTHY